VKKEEEEAGEVEEEQAAEGEAEPSNQRAHAPGTSLTGGSGTVRPRRLPRAPARYADCAVQDNNDDDEEEETLFPELVMRRSRNKGGGGNAGSSRFQGVSWATSRLKWKSECMGNFLGYHTTEEAAARACSKYLEDGIVPVKHRQANTSQFMGVRWNTREHKWKVQCKDIYLGHHTTEEAAARAYNKYLEDGIDPVKHREANTSQFKGVRWNKQTSRWRATCEGKHLGYHTTEKAAAQAYNVEAERVGRPLNVIPPGRDAVAGAGPGAGMGMGGGAGPKRAAPNEPATPATSQKTKRRAASATLSAPATSKKMKL
jgi:hypothetical protein